MAPSPLPNNWPRTPAPRRCRRAATPSTLRIATNAVMAVVAPHQCGMGGDLFALVHKDGTTMALNASGRGRIGCRPGRTSRRGPHRDAAPPRHPHRHGSWLRRRLDRLARALRHDATRRPVAPATRLTNRLSGESSSPAACAASHAHSRLSWRPSPPARTSAPEWCGSGVAAALQARSPMAGAPRSTKVLSGRA